MASAARSSLSGQTREVSVLVVKVYAVMTALTVEVSCVGHGPQNAGHLLFREQRVIPGLEFWEVVQAASESLSLAAHELERGELESYDDCYL